MNHYARTFLLQSPMPLFFFFPRWDPVGTVDVTEETSIFIRSSP